jgi:hypothetical protein
VRLATLLARRNGGIVINEHVEANDATVFAVACRMGLEEIVSKRLDVPPPLYGFAVSGARRLGSEATRLVFVPLSWAYSRPKLVYLSPSQRGLIALAYSSDDRPSSVSGHFATDQTFA